MNYDYFSTASDMANENYSNYDGWSNLVGDGGYNYAGGQPSVDARASLPYIINISNSTTTDQSSVVILNANNPGTSPNFNNNAAITITYSSGSVTYAEFLRNIQSQPFTVGLIQLQCSNGSQILQNLTITHKEVNGIVNTIPVTPVLDPYQNQATITNVYVEFVVDSFTSISTTILASATLVMRLYPKVESNIARTLADRSAMKQYAKPNFSQMQLPNGGPIAG